MSTYTDIRNKICKESLNVNYCERDSYQEMHLLCADNIYNGTFIGTLSGKNDEDSACIINAKIISSELSDCTFDDCDQIDKMSADIDELSSIISGFGGKPYKYVTELDFKSDLSDYWSNAERFAEDYGDSNIIDPDSCVPYWMTDEYAKELYNNKRLVDLVKYEAQQCANQILYHGLDEPIACGTILPLLLALSAFFDKSSSHGGCCDCNCGDLSCQCGCN